MRRNITAALALILWGAGFTAAAVAQQLVKLGVLNDQTGLYADLTGMGSVHAARMAVEDYGGKVLGRPIEVIFADHQNKPDVGANIARQWIENEGVNVILDIPNSAVGLAVREVTRTHDAIDINTGAATSDLSGKACSPHGVHWSFDTYGLAATIGRALVKQGGDTWFFITADYAFGHALERDTTAFVTAGGGKVLGSVRHPLNTADFSSFVLQAQNSGADTVGLANAGGDLNNCIKQAHEFGLSEKQRLAGLILNITNIPSLGLDVVDGATICTGFYWDANEGTRAFAKRFQAAHPKKMMPNDMHAGMYAATEHLMKAVAQIKGADDGVKVVDTMKAIPTDDPLFGKGIIRVDGRKLHPMYLYKAKTPADSKYDWDYFQLVATIKPEDAFRPLDKGGCPFVKA